MSLPTNETLSNAFVFYKFIYIIVLMYTEQDLIFKLEMCRCIYTLLLSDTLLP